MEEQSHFSIKAIMIGWVTDQVVTFVGSFIIGFVATIVFILVTKVQGGNLNQMATDKFQEQFYSAPILLIMEGTFGLLCTMVGGFVTAYLAKVSEIKHSFAMGSLSLATSILLIRLIPQPLPLWYNLWAGGLMIPFAVLGGFVRLKTKKFILK